MKKFKKLCTFVTAAAMMLSTTGLPAYASGYHSDSEQFQDRIWVHKDGMLYQSTDQSALSVSQEDVETYQFNKAVISNINEARVYRVINQGMPSAHFPPRMPQLFSMPETRCWKIPSFIQFRGQASPFT